MITEDSKFEVFQKIRPSDGPTSLRTDVEKCERLQESYAVKSRSGCWGYEYSLDKNSFNVSVYLKIFHYEVLERNF